MRKEINTNIWQTTAPFICSRGFVGLLCDPKQSPSHLPRGSSPSSRRHRTVGAGSPWTSHWKSTVSSSITTWLTGRRTSTGRSAGEGEGANRALFLPDPRALLTVHHQLCWVTVPLSHHVLTNADIHACVVLSGVRDHQFAATHL